LSNNSVSKKDTKIPEEVPHTINWLKNKNLLPMTRGQGRRNYRKVVFKIKPKEKPTVETGAFWKERGVYSTASTKYCDPLSVVAMTAPLITLIDVIGVVHAICPDFSWESRCTGLPTVTSSFEMINIPIDGVPLLVRRVRR
jgi:hypothetical protein